MKKVGLLSLIAVLGLQFCVTPGYADDFNIPTGGTINTHDINSFKEFEREKEMNSDFEKFQKTEENQPKQEEVKKKREKAQVEATVKEYATKGIFVKNIEVSKSDILTEDEIKEIIDNYTNDNLTMKDMQAIVNDINNLYLKKGYVTARAYIPPQQVKDKTIKIILIEGRVGDITITGNKWTRTNFIKDRVELNDIKPGNIFKIGVLENNLVNFNKYNYGVDLKGTLTPGKEQGTTDIALKTEEKSPFHVSAILDNCGRDTIGNTRGGLIFQDDSLFGFRDKLTLGAYASRYSATPFADYNIPVNKKDGRVGFMFSFGNSKVGYGPFAPLDINNRSYTYSLYYTQPIIRKSYMELVSNTSINYKQSAMSIDGYELNKNRIPSVQTGLSLRYDTQRGIWYVYQNVGYSFPFFDHESNYVKIDGGFTRLHDFGHGVVGQLRANYQVIPTNIVPSIDQFQIGGMNTVRGYSEGLLIGRSGYFASAELQFPIAARTILTRDKTKRLPFIGNYIKGLVFVDQGMVFPYKGSGMGSQSIDSSDFLLSAGVGLKVNLPGDLSAKLSWGFPMLRNYHMSTSSNWGRFHFELCLSPDFDALVRMRHPKEKTQKQTL